MQYKCAFVTAFIFSLFCTSTFAAECAAKSGAHTVTLLELYTSEGCSSCPPADAWLSDLTPNPTQFIPLAFHVDYWDYIGWKDPFAKPAYTHRQRATASFAGTSVIYTPQFVLNGKDFRSWNSKRLAQAIERNQKIASPVALSLRLNNTQNAYSVDVQANNLHQAGKVDVFVAIYENNLSNQVNAGENHGRLLKHDYVVRDLFGAYTLNAQGTLNKQFTLPPTWNNRAGGVAIFAQNASTGEILQSLALPFCGS
jgi:hypothetical protein